MLWLKGVGAITLIITGALVGLRLSKNLELRRRKLNRFYVFIRELWGGIKIGEEIDSILDNSIDKNLIYREGLSIKLNSDGLKGEDVKLLSEFLSLIGMGDTESQVLRCETYSELVKKRLDSAEHEVKEKAKLYSTLGFFSGLLVVILFV
ncbi:MAG: stage III sporulation protein AB [Clostridia bacterium]|nr:stage III sporulation protein AB [Clostridia bacterium]